MTLALIPQPRKLVPGKGKFTLPQQATIGISDSALYPLADEVRVLFRRADINAVRRGKADVFTMSLRRTLKPSGYRLRIGPDGIRLEARDATAAFYGLQTLEQIIVQTGRSLPCLAIDDWPDFEDRGLYYDVARGRVPKLEQLFELAGILAHYKMNQLQLYIEHTFAFRGHPSIGRGCSPLTAEDILQIDEYCRSINIELVPSLASFGHMSPVLRLKEYRHMAEDWGVGRYVDPAAKDTPQPAHMRGWTISPANPGTYRFLESLFAEFLPLFSSKRFNICCDETWDLAQGQTHDLARKRGKGKVYLDHILKLRDICGRYGKKVMFWGDIIRHYPELIGKIPRDVTVLDWAYSSNHPFATIRDFKKAGVPFYACPGTSAWVSLFPRLHESAANIAGFARAGKRNGAAGLLNTDWGDGGHYNFMEYSWYGYLFGAEQAWNTGADLASFTRRFARLFFNTDRKDVAQAIDVLGDVTHLSVVPYYQSIWQHIFFACPGDAVLQHRDPVKVHVSRKGKLAWKQIRLNAATGRAAAKRIAGARKALAAHAQVKGGDPMVVLPYWVFAADTIAHAARKLAVLGPGGDDTAANRKALRKEMASLMKRFEDLWMARNRRSEIRTTLRRYRKAIAALGKK